MEVFEAIMRARGAISAKRVFGDPYKGDGVVVIPAARIRGGAGGGGGEGPAPAGQGGTGSVGGSGAGFGVIATPVGAYVITKGKVRWKPALDLNGILMRTQAAALIIAVLMLLRRRR